MSADIAREVEVEEDVFLPCYHHLLYDAPDYDIDFLYGGRDSGKSRQVAMMLVIACINESYFKCLLIRKVQNTVRDSQYELIKEIIESWGLTGFFSFRESKLQIIYRENGNGFYGRGLDNAAKIKSFNNPSTCWIEEGNQITSEDLVTIQTSLRANRKVKTWFTFNPECEGTYTDFWLYKDYFSHTQLLSFTWRKHIETPKGPAEINIRATHTTYLDNPYCPPQRAALYESYRTSKNNSYYYQTYTLGLWGYRRTGGEFWKCFEREKHVKHDLDFTRETIHAVVDNNRNPYIAISLWQIDIQAKKLQQVGEIPAASPSNTATKSGLLLTNWLKNRGYRSKVYLYGDPSANSKTTEDDDGKSFFDKFKGALNSDGYRIEDRVQKSAPEVAMSGEFVNEIYESNFDGWSIEISDTCIKSIEDYTMTKEAADGTMIKHRIKDKETGQTYEPYGHFSDDKRYFITTVLKAQFNKFLSRRITRLQNKAGHFQ